MNIESLKTFEPIWNTHLMCPTMYQCNDGMYVKKSDILELILQNQRTKLRSIIIELGRRGVIGASERDTAVVDDICKREGVVL